MPVNETIQKDLEGIGKVTIQKNSRARNIRIKIHPEKGVVLVVPVHSSEQSAIKFALEKKSWIQRTLKRSQTIKSKATVFSEETLFTTKYRQLVICKHAKSTIKSVVSANQIFVYYPEYALVNDPKIQQIIRRAIEAAWRLEAQKFLPERVAQLAKEHGFSFEKVSIKKASTRWGSCSFKNNINLNIQLIRLPERLCDYVILHELVHTVEKNHQAGFWNLLQKVLPEAKKLDKELNQYNLNYW